MMTKFRKIKEAYIEAERLGYNEDAEFLDRFLFYILTPKELEKWVNKEKQYLRSLQ